MTNPSDFFECQKCGECCKGFGGTFVTEADVERIAAFLRIGRETLVTRYCDWSGSRRVLRTGESGYCVFWDGLCTIHEVKPRMCKIWPFIDSLMVDPDNWAVMKTMCPGMKDNRSTRELLECVSRVLEAHGGQRNFPEGART